MPRDKRIIDMLNRKSLKKMTDESKIMKNLTPNRSRKTKDIDHLLNETLGDPDYSEIINVLLELKKIGISS